MDDHENPTESDLDERELDALLDEQIKRLRRRIRVSRGLLRASALLMMLLIAGLFYVAVRAVEVNRQAMTVSGQAVENSRTAERLAAKEQECHTRPAPSASPADTPDGQILTGLPNQVVPLIVHVPMPDSPLPEQMRAPCPRHTLALRGVCWLVYHNSSRPPVGDDPKAGCGPDFYDPPPAKDLPPKRPDLLDSCFKAVSQDTNPKHAIKK